MGEKGLAGEWASDRNSNLLDWVRRYREEFVDTGLCDDVTVVVNHNRLNERFQGGGSVEDALDPEFEFDDDRERIINIYTTVQPRRGQVHNFLDGVPVLAKDLDGEPENIDFLEI